MPQIAMIMMMMMMMMMMTIFCTLGRERVKTNLLIHGYSQNPFLYFFTFILLKTSSRENTGIVNTLHCSSAFTSVVYNFLIISTTPHMEGTSQNGYTSGPSIEFKRRKTL